jgi:endonuclease I
MHRSILHSSPATALVACLALLVCPTGSAQVINEYLANHTGIDDHEYIEIFGQPDTSYANLTILQIEGDIADGPGILDSAIPVGTTDPGGFWQTGFLNNQLHNDNMSLLLVDGFTGTVGEDLDSDDDGVLDLTPWTQLVDEVGVKAQDSVKPGYVYTSFDLYPGTDGVWYTWGGGSRIPNGVDSDTAHDWVRNDFDGEGLPGFSGTLGPLEAVNTPGAENQAYVPRAPVINEVVIDHIGADDHEFIEIFGEASADYSSHRIVVLDGGAAGNPGAVDFVAQPGLVNGGSSWTTGFLAPDSLANRSQTILLVTGFTGSEGDDLDTDDDGVLDSTPWTAVDDSVAFDAGGLGDHSYAAPVLGAGFDGLPTVPGGASRATSGFDSGSVDDWVRNDFDGEGLTGFAGDLGPMEAYNTPGLANRRRIEDYYATADAGDPATLRATLHEIIDDHVRHAYTADVTDTWDILDPASEDPNEPLNILDVYKNASYPKAGAGNSNYDREHTWPKSYGFSTDSPTNSPYTDCHHLFPAAGAYNGSRSNKPFDTCDGACEEWTTDVNNNAGGGSGVYPGNSNWTDALRWETWVGRRGDVARAVMYMAVRYEGGSNGVTGFPEPDLVLTDDAGLIQTTSSSPAYMGLLSTVLAWHAEDPVDGLERHRVDVVWRHQGNRNPFIDHPEWARCVFAGQDCGSLFVDGFESGGTGAWSSTTP